MKQTRFNTSNEVRLTGLDKVMAWIMVIFIMSLLWVAVTADEYEERMNQSKVEESTTEYSYTYHIYTAPMEKPNTPTIVTTPEVTSPVIPEETVPDETVPVIPEVPEIPTTEESEEITPEAQARISAYGPGEKYYYCVSDYEKILMAKVVWAECRAEPFEGQVAVAAVILNRFSQNAPYGVDARSIESVVTQKWQFASISHVTMKDLEQYPNCMEAVEAACKGWDPTRKVFPDGALYFYNPEKVSQEQKDRREGCAMMSIGDHDFHRDMNPMK